MRLQTLQRVIPEISMLVRMTALFPVWAILGVVLAWFVPDAFTACRPAILPLLGVVMFGMGAGLRVENFLAVLRRPAPVFLGLVLQFLMMPLAGWLLALLAGHLVRFVRIPEVTGYLLAGVALGPSVLGWVSHENLQALEVMGQLTPERKERIEEIFE